MNRFIQSDVHRYLEKLTLAEKNLLREAAYCGGRVQPSTFIAKYNANCPRPGRWISKRDSSLIHLVIAVDEDTGEIFVPQDVIAAVKPLMSKPPTVTIRPVEKIPDVLDVTSDGFHDDVGKRPIHQYSSERMACGELRRVLTLVQSGKVRVQEKSCRPTSATERAVAGALLAADFDLELPESARDQWSLESGAVRAHAWPVVLQQCGWCKPRSGKLELTREGKQLLGEFQLQVYRRGIERLGNDDKLDELNRINNIRGQSGKGKRYLTRPSSRRQATFVSMSQWPVNRWVSLDAAYRFIFATGNSLVAANNPYQFYFCERQYGYIDDSDGLSRQYLRAMLMETLATLGIVDIAYVYPHYLWPNLGGGWGTDDMDFCGRYDGLLYVRLNLLGAYCLGVTDHYEPPEMEKRRLFTVLPNRELALAGQEQPSTADTGMLELFAKQKSDRLWRLDQRQILAFVENGGTLDEIQHYLESNSAEDIPETVRVFFADIAAKTDIVVGSQDALLIEVKDATTAALIANDTKTKKYCFLSGKKHLAVIKKNEKAFRSALKHLGYVLPQ